MQRTHQPDRTTHRVLAASAMILTGLAFVLLLQFLLAGAATATAFASETGAPTASTCASVTTVSLSECMALVEFFSQTHGANWLNNSHWLTFDSGDAPCNWHGVTCADGHVTGLVLARNQLSGALPLSLGNLRGLRQLRLEQNALRGRIPPNICNLAPGLTDLSLAYNALFTMRASVERCLQPLEPDWLATQTIMVTGLHITEFFTDGFRLAWNPIAYQGDGGHYEIAVATAISGPFLIQGQTPDKQSAGYWVTDLEPGRTYYVSVRAHTPAHDDQTNALWGAPARIAGVTNATTGRVLLAAYFAADNNLATEIDDVKERFRRGSALNPNIQVTLLVDGDDEGDTVVFEIARGSISATTAVEEHWGSHELDTSDPAVLAWFLRLARTSFPAERTIVTLMGHGIPPTPKVTWSPVVTSTIMSSRSRGEIPPLPKGHEYSPSDLTNRGYMSTIDVGQALMEATDEGAAPFDLIFFDQCFQGSLDVLYEVRQTANVFVASPNYAWLVAAYQKYLTQLTPTATPEEMAQAIIDLYQGSLDNRHPNTIFWLRSSDIVAIADAVSGLGDALLDATRAGETQKIANAVRQSQYVDTTQCGRQNLQLGPPDELIGLESFGAQLRQQFGAGDAYGVADALEALYTAMQPVEKRTRIGRPYIAPEEVWEYGNTLTVLAPLPRNSPADVAWRASLYRADAPFTATWTIDPSQTVTVTESLAYVKEGRWDEFLAEWYTDLMPTVGQWCHYIPPQQVIGDESEALVLSVAQHGGNGLQLNWTPADDISATAYSLYHWGPYDISWTGRRRLPIEQQTASLTQLDAGIHRFALLARNAEGEFVAQSNEVIVEIDPDGDVAQKTFLPLISR